MYHRIQKRLDDTNLAIGEFPEVVAESIKNAILDDSEMDNSAEELQEIRFSAQTKALEELWSSSELEKTASSVVRERLIKIIAKESPSASFDEPTGLWSFTGIDGTTFEATAIDGCDESVSYSMAVQHGIDFESDEFMVVLDGDNHPCAFTGKDYSGMYVGHESIPSFILGNPVQCDVPASVRPNMLPNPSALTLSYALDNPEPPMPRLWVEGEADEN